MVHTLHLIYGAFPRISTARRIRHESLTHLVAISSELRHELVRQNLNERPPNSGDVFFHILRCSSSDAPTIDSWWSQIRSPNEVKELKRLLRRLSLADAFRQAAKFMAFGRELITGNIGSLLRLQCDEIIVHSLLYMLSAWQRLLAGIPQAEERLDPLTLRTVRLRCPMYCHGDRKLLDPLVRRGAILGNFDATERQHIWQQMMAYPGRIPSLAVCCKDFNHLEDVAGCVRALFQIPRGQTLHRVLDQSFVSPRSAPPTTGTSDTLGIPKLLLRREDRLDLAIRRLFLATMRDLQQLCPSRIKLECRGSRETDDASVRAKYRLAKTAQELGFRSSRIAETMTQSPDRVEARRSLLRARDPQHFTYDPAILDSVVEAMVTLYEKAQPNKYHDTPAVLVTDGGGEELRRRWSRPFHQAFAESASSLTLENMHRGYRVDKTGGLTAFFVRRDIYLSFFGPLEPRLLTAVEISEGIPTSPTDSDSASSPSLVDRPRQQSMDIDSPALAPHGDTFEDGERPADDPQALVLIRQQLATTYSISHYSDDPVEDASAPANQSSHGDCSSEAADEITFVLCEGQEQKIVELVPIDDEVHAAVENIVQRYTQTHHRAFTHELRPLAPRHCVRAALEDPDRRIYLIHADELQMYHFQALGELQRKRPASTNLDTRPRKCVVNEHIIS